MTPKMRTQPKFLYNAPTAKFHNPMCIRWEVIVLTKNKHTNTQTDATENIQRSVTLRRWVNMLTTQ